VRIRHGFLSFQNIKRVNWSHKHLVNLCGISLNTHLKRRRSTYWNKIFVSGLHSMITMFCLHENNNWSKIPHLFKSHNSIHATKQRYLSLRHLVMQLTFSKSAKSIQSHMNSKNYEKTFFASLCAIRHTLDFSFFHINDNIFFA